jgi:hypothetical protein
MRAGRVSTERGEPMTRVPVFEFDGWTCEWNARKGAHTFKRGGQTIVVRSNAIPGAKHTAALPLRYARVDRTLLRRLAAWALLPPRLRAHGDPTVQPGDLVGFGNVTDGGEQGGQGIELLPTWTPETRAAMDGTIERHPCFAFNATSGAPLTRAEIGFAEQYTLDAATPNTGRPSQFAPFVAPYSGKYERWQRIDGAHLVRAFEYAVAQFAHDRDPISRFDLVNVGHDVMRSYTTSETNGWSLAAMERNVFASPHTGGLGITRWNAWCLRAVVEAQRAAPSRVFADWIRRYVGVLYMGQAECGAFERHKFGDGIDQGEPVLLFGLPERYEWCTSWQVPFMVRAVREAMRVVPETQSQGRVILERAKRLWDRAPVVGGDVYDGIATASGLNRYLVIAENGVLVDRVTMGVGPARALYDADAFACFAEVGA